MKHLQKLEHFGGKGHKKSALELHLKKSSKAFTSVGQLLE
jgi:hypothetical protein